MTNRGFKAAVWVSAEKLNRIENLKPGTAIVLTRLDSFGDEYRERWEVPANPSTLAREGLDIIIGIIEGNIIDTQLAPQD